MTLPTSTTTPRPRRLVFVITELEPGGAERCLVEIATRLNRAKYSPSVFSLAPAPSGDKRILVDRLQVADVPTTFLGFAHGWNYFSAVRRLTNLFREGRIELVQSFLFHANVVSAKAATAAAVPHHFTGLRVADPRKWRLVIERLTTARAERHVCVSQNVAEVYRWAGFDSQKLVVIPNGVDLASRNQSSSDVENPLELVDLRRAILYVGRLDKQKGLDRFFRELPLIFQHLPQHDLVLVGDGQQKDALHRLAARLGISDRVKFLGWRPEAATLIAAADLLVLPSRWEGMPNVILEAMAAGKPVVATQAEGTVELLGIAALEQTTAVGDWTGLRKRLVEIAKNTQLASQLGMKNQIRAAQFSIQTMVERYERLYDATLSGK